MREAERDRGPTEGPGTSGHGAFVLRGTLLFLLFAGVAFAVWKSPLLRRMLIGFSGAGNAEQVAVENSGLAAEERREIYRQILIAEEAALSSSDKKLFAHLKSRIAQHYGISEKQVNLIFGQGFEEGWPGPERGERFVWDAGSKKPATELLADSAPIKKSEQRMAGPEPDSKAEFVPEPSLLVQEVEADAKPRRIVEDASDPVPPLIAFMETRTGTYSHTHERGDMVVVDRPVPVFWQFRLNDAILEYKKRHETPAGSALKILRVEGGRYFVEILEAEGDARLGRGWVSAEAIDVEPDGRVED